MSRVLVVGDSFMCRESRLPYVGTHFSELLGDHDVVDAAFAGASNSMISNNLYSSTANDKFDCIILGFTTTGRFPMISPIDGKLISDCWELSFDPTDLEVINRFKTMVDLDVQAIGDYAIIKDMLNYVAAMNIPFVWAPNMWISTHPTIDNVEKRFGPLPYQEKKHPLNLMDFHDNKMEPIFHSTKDNIQRRFADICIEMLGLK